MFVISLCLHSKISLSGLCVILRISDYCQEPRNNLIASKTKFLNSAVKSQLRFYQTDFSEYTLFQKKINQLESNTHFWERLPSYWLSKQKKNSFRYCLMKLWVLMLLFCQLNCKTDIDPQFRQNYVVSVLQKINFYK